MSDDFDFAWDFSVTLQNPATGELREIDTRPLLDFMLGSTEKAPEPSGFPIPKQFEGEILAILTSSGAVLGADGKPRSSMTGPGLTGPIEPGELDKPTAGVDPWDTDDTL